MASASAGRTDLSDVERDMLLLAIIGKSARQVAITALRIGAVKDVIIGSLTEFLLDHFNVDTNVNHSDGDCSLGDDIGSRSAGERALTSDRCSGPPRMVAGGGARSKNVDGYARSTSTTADAYALPASTKAGSSSDMLLLPPPETELFPSEDLGRGPDVHQPSVLSVAPHKRLLASHRTVQRFERSAQQRRSYDAAHAAAAPVLDVELRGEEDRSRKDINGWPPAKSADAVGSIGSLDDSGRSMPAALLGQSGRQFASSSSSSTRDGSGHDGSSAAIDCGGGVSDRGRSASKLAEASAAAESQAGCMRVATSKSPAGDLYSPGAPKLMIVASGSGSLAPVQPSEQSSSRHASQASAEQMNDDQWDSASGGAASDRAADVHLAGRQREVGNAFRNRDAGSTAPSQVGQMSSWPGWYQTTRKRRSVLPPMPLSSYVDRSGSMSAASHSGASGQLNYMCPECSKDFRRQSELNRHVKIVHRQEKPYQCDQCGIPFATRWNLKCHYNKQHFQQFQSQAGGSAHSQRAAITVSESFDDDVAAGREGSAAAAAEAAMFERDACPDGIVVVEPESVSSVVYRSRNNSDSALLMDAPNLKLEAGD